MPSATFEPAIPAIKWLQTYALDLTATMIGFYGVLIRFNTAMLILKQKYLDFNPWRERREGKTGSEGVG
jgi:hypothetical protein